MSGEQIGEIKGSFTSTTIVSVERGLPVMQFHLSGEGVLLDHQVTLLATHEQTLQKPGSWLGDGRGVVRAKDGADLLTWQGTGVGTENREGITWRGSLYLRTGSARFQELDGVSVIAEFEQLDDGTVVQRWSRWA